MKKIQTSPSVRCAIYVRSATNYRDSLAEQEQKCRAAAKQSPTWTIVEDCIFRDMRASGLRPYDWPGLDSLLERAKECPGPFDYILVTETLRLGRNLSHVLQITCVGVSSWRRDLEGHTGGRILYQDDGLSLERTLQALIAVHRPPRPDKSQPATHRSCLTRPQS
jgi:hypothetical protein